MLTVPQGSAETRILARMCEAGEVERMQAVGGRITYRLVPFRHPYRRRDVVILTRPNGMECRARVVGASPESVRITTFDDGMVRNVDPEVLKHAYKSSDDTLLEDLMGAEYYSTFGRALTAWLAAKSARSCSIRAKRSYIEILSNFYAALREARLELDSAPHEVAAVARIWATRYHAKQSEQAVNDSVSPATFNQRLATVSSFYRHSLQHGYFDGTNPIDLVERQTIPSVRTRLMNRSESS